MPPETCEQHTQFVADMAVVKNDLHYIRNKICRHVEEGEKDGGFRDRLLIVEREVAELKNRFWLSAVVGGLIGTLVGSGSKDVLSVIAKWFIGG